MALSTEQEFFPGRHAIDPAKEKRAADAAQPEEGDSEFGGPIALPPFPGRRDQPAGILVFRAPSPQCLAGGVPGARRAVGSLVFGAVNLPSGWIRR